MGSLYDHDRAQRVQFAVHGVGDLGREALLELGPFREALHHARQLRETGHPAVRHVPHVRLAGEREEMVFAQTCHRQVADEDQVTRLFGESALEVAGGVFGEAGEESDVGLCYTLGRL